MEKKYEGFNMVTVEVKQTEIILDLLSNGFKSSNSILRKFKFIISMMIAPYDDNYHLA